MAGDNWREEILAGRIRRETIGGKILAGYSRREINKLDYDINSRYNTTIIKIHRYTTTQIKIHR